VTRAVSSATVGGMDAFERGVKILMFTVGAALIAVAGIGAALLGVINTL